MTSSPAAACLNCGAPLSGEFCSTCGQRVPHTDLTLREFLHETTEQLVNWDGKIPQTLKTLLTKPGALTIDFLAGRRARWLLPLRVYLICSLTYFVTKAVIESATNRSARSMAEISITNDDGSTTLTPEVIAEIERGLPARIFGKDRLVRAASNPKQLNAEINTAFPKAMFVLLPFFALLTRIAWRKRVPRYPAHLYFALHVHAAWFAALTVNIFANDWLLPIPVAVVIGLAVISYIVWYALVASRLVFQDSWGKTLLKSAAISVIYGAAFGAVAMLLLGYALTRM